MKDATAPVHQDTRVLAAFEPSTEARPNPEALRAAEHWLRRGVPVVIPTETVYGLAAPALDRSAVEAVFRIKGRPADNPLIVHVSDKNQLHSIGAELTPLAALLIGAFWPGPLTLVLSTRASLPWVTAGLDSVAVRQPAHEFAMALIERVGPLAAPSANLSGRPSPTRARDALDDLFGWVPLVVDGGELEHGLESTVLDVRGELPVLLRPGAVTVEALEAACRRTVQATQVGAAARSPGMKYRHYSPRAEIWLYSPPAGSTSGTLRELAEDARRLRASGRRVAAIAHHPIDVDHFIQCPLDSKELGRRMFGWLRDLDELGVDCILIEGVSPAGMGRAIMDRLERAATRIRGAEREPEPPQGPAP